MSTSQHINNLIDSLPAPTLILCDQLTINYANAAFEKLTGFSQDQLLGLSIEEIVVGSQQPTDSFLQMHDVPALLHPRASHYTGQGTVRHQAGHLLAVQINSSRTRLYDVEHHVLTVEHIRPERDDASQTTRAQDEPVSPIEKLRAAIIRNVNHELLTPIHGISGMLDLLKMTDANPEQLEYIDSMRNSIIMLTQVVRALSDYADGESARSRLFPKPINLKSLCALVALEQGAQIGEKNLQIKLDYDLECPLNLVADPERISQALSILVGNAIKFSNRGEIRIRVGCSADSNGIHLVRIEVQDPGIGIPPVMQDRIFEPFFQVDVSLARRYTGVGLGLTIFRQLVELMEGRQGLHSRPDEGSLFWFEIPLPGSSFGPPPAVFNP